MCADFEVFKLLELLQQRAGFEQWQTQGVNQGLWDKIVFKEQLLISTDLNFGGMQSLIGNLHKEQDSLFHHCVCGGSGYYSRYYPTFLSGKG